MQSMCRYHAHSKAFFHGNMDFQRYRYEHDRWNLNMTESLGAKLGPDPEKNKKILSLKSTKYIII